MGDAHAALDKTFLSREDALVATGGSDAKPVDEASVPDTCPETQAVDLPGLSSGGLLAGVQEVTRRLSVGSTRRFSVGSTAFNMSRLSRTSTVTEGGVEPRARTPEPTMSATASEVTLSPPRSLLCTPAGKRTVGVFSPQDSSKVEVQHELSVSHLLVTD